MSLLAVSGSHPTTLSTHELNHAVYAALTQRPPTEVLPPDDLARIAQIIDRNLASGRVRRLLGDNIEAKLPDYITRVFTTYTQEVGRLTQLAGANEEEWDSLRLQLIEDAHRLLRRIGLPEVVIKQLAMEYAHDTCETLYRTPFPFDVPFLAWARRILTNKILKDYSRSPDITFRQRFMPSLDEIAHTETDNAVVHEAVADERSLTDMEDAERHAWLMGGITRLNSEEQRQVILWTYFSDLSDTDIARQLGKTNNAIHVLRHRALQRLAKFLQT